MKKLVFITYMAIFIFGILLGMSIIDSQNSAPNLVTSNCEIYNADNQIAQLPTIEYAEVNPEKLLTFKATKQEVVETVKYKINTNNEYAKEILEHEEWDRVSKELGLSEEQIILAKAITIHETGWFKSEAFKTRNNIGGNFYNGELMRFSTFEKGLEFYLKNLKRNYFDMGLNTIEEIQPKYAPLGAGNDPNNLNSYWVTNVQKLMDDFTLST